MELGDNANIADLGPKQKKKSKKDNIVKEAKPRLTPKLVNPWVKHPFGANSWHRLYDPALCEAVPELYVGGKSDAEVAVAIGISKMTFYDWIKKYPQFREAVYYGRSHAEVPFQEAGRAAAFGERQINGMVWAANMRNRFGYDDARAADVVDDDEKQKSLRILTEDKIDKYRSDI